MTRTKTLPPLFLALLLHGCASSGPVVPEQTNQPTSDQSQPARSGNLALLDNKVEFAAYEARPVREVFADLALALFGSRLEVVGDVEAEFQGEVSLRPLRDALDEVCQQSQCSWDVEGTPPKLILYLEGKQ